MVRMVSETSSCEGSERQGVGFRISGKKGPGLRASWFGLDQGVGPGSGFRVRVARRL